MSVALVVGGLFATQALLAPAGALADTVVNPFSGLWNTTLTYQSSSIPGTVKFTAIDATTGANALQAIGGHPCGAPTTYYHGDYTDMPDASTTQTGVMTACIVPAGHLVGRWAGGGDQGDLDVTLNSAQSGFAGSFSDDMFGITQGYSGTFSSHFPGDGCCITTPPPPPPPPPKPTPGFGWVIGGGVDLHPEAPFCRVQRGLLPAGDLASAAQASGIFCTLKKLLNKEKADARKERKLWLLLVANFCNAASDVGLGRSNDVPELVERKIWRALFLRRLCAAAVDGFAEAAALANDPPDPAFAVPPGRATVPPLAQTAESTCPHGLTRSQCAALRTASANYIAVTGLFASVAGDIATGANRVSGAVKANSPPAAFFQEAFAKINEGALATDAAALRSDGKQFAALLRADHLDIRFSAADVTAMSQHPPSGLSGAQRKELIAQLPSLTGTTVSAALTAAIPASSFAEDYRSISIIDLASIVNGLVHNGDFSVAVGQTLATDLTNAQDNCNNASQRIAAMNQFVADVHTNAAPDAQFLSFGAQPLLATGIPAALCGTGTSSPPPASPSFTGNWNTTFGPMQLTQTGNQITGTYAICNGTSTISGTVTGSTLDGTWTEPCDGGQGHIHFVLSADGKSFTGLWGVGNATPSAAWNGTRS